MKRCLLLCEGPFDELIFSLLKDLFDESILEIKPFGGCCADTTYLKSKVGKIVNELLAKEHGYCVDDFCEICFLIDADGIYISDSQIIENQKLRFTVYKNKTIECPNKKFLISRNRRRSKNIDDLLLTEHNYWIFYNSRNLEHSFDESLSGRVNESKKKQMSLQIYSYFSENKKEFIEKLFLMNKSKTLNIYNSWKYLKCDSNSLSSTSNIIIFVMMHFYALKEEYKNVLLHLIKG